MELDDTTLTRRSPGEPGGLDRVQVGSGPHHLRRDWWNTDLRTFSGIDEAMDATTPWRWSNILEYVYAEHFLEHLDFHDAIAFLMEAGKALKLGGRIRLTTPSLEWVIKTHFLFEPDDVDTKLLDTFRVNRAFHGWGHKFLYSSAMLRRLLEEVGYCDVEFFDYNNSHDPALRNLEMHGDHSVDFGFPSVWIVEASKLHENIAASPAFLAYVERTFGQYIRGGH